MRPDKVEKAITDFLERKIKLWKIPLAILTVFALFFLSIFSFDVWRARKSIEDMRNEIEQANKEAAKIAEFRQYFEKSLGGMNTALGALLDLAVASSIFSSPEKLSKFPGGKIEAAMHKEYLMNLQRYITIRSIDLQVRVMSDKSYNFQRYKIQIQAIRKLIEAVNRFSDWRYYAQSETQGILEKSIELDQELAPTYIWLAHYLINVELRKSKPPEDEKIATESKKYLDKAEHILNSEKKDLEARLGWIHPSVTIIGDITSIELENLTEKQEILNKIYAHLLSVRGQLLYNREDFAGAIVSFKNALNNNPDNPVYYNRAGYAAYKKGDYDKAEKTLQDATKKAEEKKLGDYAQALNGLAEMYIQKANKFSNKAFMAVMYAQRAVDTKDPNTTAFALDSLAAALASEPLRFYYEAMVTQYKAMNAVNDLPEEFYPLERRNREKVARIDLLHKYIDKFIKNGVPGTIYEEDYRMGMASIFWALSCWEGRRLGDAQVLQSCQGDQGLNEIYNRAILAIHNFKKLMGLAGTRLDLRAALWMGYAIDLFTEVSAEKNKGSLNIKKEYEDGCAKIGGSGNDCKFPDDVGLYKAPLQELTNSSQPLVAAGFEKSNLATGILLNNWVWRDYLLNNVNDETVQQAIFAARTHDWKDPRILHTLGSLFERNADKSPKEELLRGWSIIWGSYCYNRDNDEIKSLYRKYINKLEKRKIPYQKECPNN